MVERHGIEWEDKDTHDKHLSVMGYKKEQRAKEIAEPGPLESVKSYQWKKPNPFGNNFSRCCAVCRTFFDL